MENEAEMLKDLLTGIVVWLPRAGGTSENISSVPEKKKLEFNRGGDESRRCHGLPRKSPVFRIGEEENADRSGGIRSSN